MRLHYFAIIFFGFSCILSAQNPGDTIVVQSFDYSMTYGVNQWSPGIRDTTVYFPTDTSLQFEKILMLYNMRCKDNKVSNSSNRDQGCGEWDISCNTFIHDENKIDSTLKTHPDYIISNFVGNTFNYSNSPVFDYHQRLQPRMVVDSVISETQGDIGSGLSASEKPINLMEKAGKSIYLFTATELSNSGLSSGLIKAMSLYVSSNPDRAKFFTIRLKSTTQNTLDPANPDLTGFTQVYHHNSAFTSGANKFFFHTPFNWNGTDNLLVEISFSKSGANQGMRLSADSLTSLMGLETSGERTLEFYQGNHLETKGYKGILGSNDRTLEAWIKTTAKGKEIISFGTNATGVKWVFRTNGSGLLRVEIGGGYVVGSTDVTDGNWHHVACVFSGNNVTDTKFYVDGVLETISSVGSRAVNTTSGINLRVSKGHHNFYFIGNIQNIRVWDAALLGNTIADYMHQEVDANHPNINNLQINYPLNEGSGAQISNVLGNGIDAEVQGGTFWNLELGEDHFKNFSADYLRPKMSFFQGNYNTTLYTDTIIDSVSRPVYTAYQYQVFSNPGILKDDSIGLVATNNYYEANFENYYDYQGNLLNTTLVTPDGTINVNQMDYYQRNAMKFEIMSFVTPYGLGLNLGPNGKTWTFDLTDFAPIFKGPKRITMEYGGQWMEDMDIKFLFIVGTPPRDVMDIEQIWRVSKQSYTNIQNDVFFEPREIKLNPAASGFKVRSSITGHGQEGEFIPRNHTFNVNGGNPEFSWSVWKECAENPIYPQGGTWIYDRAGWCPGMATDIQHFEITDLVTPGQKTELDYNVTAGAGSSNYIVNHQLVTYGAPNFTLDARVLDIVAPSDKIENARKTSMCGGPKVVIQNTGSTTLTSLEIVYWVNTDHVRRRFQWSGSLEFLESEEVTLPAGADLWEKITGPSNNTFHVEVKKPNNGTDEYPLNNKMDSKFDVPDVLPNDFFIWLRTNAAGHETNYAIYDDAGNAVHTVGGLSSYTNYRDTLNLVDGCYTLVVKDTDDDGISFWANNDGSGFIEIRSLANARLVKFEPDFGDNIRYSFTVNSPLSFEELHPVSEVRIYPNPASEKLYIDFPKESTPEVTLTDIQGKELPVISNLQSGKMVLETGHLAKGVYLVRVNLNGNTKIEKVTVQ